MNNINKYIKNHIKYCNIKYALNHYKILLILIPKMDAELLITKVGGEDVVYKAIARFIDLCLADEVIAPYFAKADIPHVTAMM